MHQALTAAEIEHVKKITNTGELYYDYDPLIEQARNHAFYVCRQFNQTFATNRQGEMQLMIFLVIWEAMLKLAKDLLLNLGLICTLGIIFMPGRI